MATPRMGPGARPGGARFAQFKLVLLGKVIPSVDYRLLLIQKQVNLRSER